jgi:peptide/nickel transport system substrate-binding protein
VSGFSRSQNERVAAVCTSRTGRLVSIVGAVAAAALLAGGAAAAVAPQTATVIMEQGAPCLNFMRAGCDFGGARASAGVALPGAFRVTPAFVYEPMLVDHVDVEQNPFALTYHLRANAVWSDGTPVSADDLLFTHAVIVDPNNSISTRAGHDLVVQATKLGPKTARFVFSARYAPWKTLFRAVLPKHALEGEDFDQVWQTELTNPKTGQPVGSGPFLVTAWTGGGTVFTLTRNPLWWGPHAPYLDTITLRVVTDSNAQFQAMREGTGDVLAPQPQLAIADVRLEPHLIVQTHPGRALEHLDFNTASTTMPLLGQKWFRQAVAHALDRPSSYPTAYGAISPDFGVPQNLTFPLGHPHYQPSFARHDYDVAAVADIMEGHGCVLGGDEVWACGGVRASIQFMTTAGNQTREQVQQQLKTAAAAAGIELVVNNPPIANFIPMVMAQQYELALYAWILPSEPANHVFKYGCGGSQNWLGYCSTAATGLLDAAQVETDTATRASYLNGANDVIAEDVPTLPLFQRPSFLVSRKTLQGPRNNPSESSPTWNVEDWFNGSFADVPPSNPFYSHIEQLLTAGITTGCGTNEIGRRLYCPADHVPRQQMAAFLIRAKGLTQLVPATPTFADVPQSNPFYGYIERLYEEEITSGCGTNGQGQLLYCPNDSVPRQQMAAFLIRATGLVPLDSPTPTFADVPQSNPFYGHIEQLYEQGITSGCGTNGQGQLLYCPNDSVPRQQMAAFLMRAFD